jgi:hypothetical protein
MLGTIFLPPPSVVATCWPAQSGEGVVAVGPKNNWQELFAITPAFSYEVSERDSMNYVSYT